jgi:hypothetical protein
VVVGQLPLGWQGPWGGIVPRPTPDPLPPSSAQPWPTPQDTTPNQSQPTLGLLQPRPLYCSSGLVPPPLGIHHLRPQVSQTPLQLSHRGAQRRQALLVLTGVLTGVLVGSSVGWVAGLCLEWWFGLLVGLLVG